MYLQSFTDKKRACCSVILQHALFLYILAGVLFPVFCRGHPHCLFKGLVEEFDIVKSTVPGDLGGVDIGGLEKPASLCDPQLLYVRGDRSAGGLFEDLPEIVFAEKDPRNDFIQIDMGLVVFLHIADSLLHQLLVVIGKFRPLAVQFPEELDDQFNEIGPQKGLGTHFPPGVLPVDLLKKLVVFLCVGLDQMV